MDPYTMSKPTVCNRPLEILEALGHACKNIFNFHGRARRSEFWWTEFAVYIINFILYFISLPLTFGNMAVMENADPMAALGSMMGFISFWVVVGIIEFILLLGVTVRRLHDCGHTGWWLIAPAAFIVIFSLLLWALSTGEGAMWPIVLLFISIIVYMGFAIWIFIMTVLDSQPFENKYGPSQKYSVEVVAPESSSEETEPVEEQSTIVEQTEETTDFVEPQA